MSSKMGLSLRLRYAKEIDLKKDNELFAIFWIREKFYGI